MQLVTLREGNEKKNIVQEANPFTSNYALYPFLICPVIDFSGDYLGYYLGKWRELNET